MPELAAFEEGTKVEDTENRVPVGLVFAAQLAIVGKLCFSINLPRRAELLLIFKSGRGYTKKEDSRLAERR
jgi:hypothetical protein